VLLFAILADVRGATAVNAFDRQISSSRVQRQALRLAINGANSLSAVRGDLRGNLGVCTVGLSPGITAALPAHQQQLPLEQLDALRVPGRSRRLSPGRLTCRRVLPVG
jgi:hypothetical protein